MCACGFLWESRCSLLPCCTSRTWRLLSCCPSAGSRLAPPCSCPGSCACLSRLPLVLAWLVNISTMVALLSCSSVVSSCALGTFTSVKAVNSVVGTVLGLPLIMSFHSVKVCMRNASNTLRTVSDSYFWWLSGFIAFHKSNFRTWTSSTAFNNVLLYLFVSAFTLLLHHFVGLSGLGKYYLAPLVVFYLWHSISIKVGRTLEISFREDEVLTRITEAISKQYIDQPISLPSVSRLISKAEKILTQRSKSRAVYLLEKFVGWEQIVPSQVVSKSLYTFATSKSATPLKNAVIVQKDVVVEDPDAETPEGVEEPIDRSWNDYKVDYAKIYKLGILHLGVYGAYRLFTEEVDVRTKLLGLLMYYLCGVGITGGYHRFWAHKSYETSYPVQVLLAWFGAACGEGSIFWWARDHRMHHKYSDTDRDPYPIAHGFFWAHMGWLMFTKNKKTIETGRILEKAGQFDDLKNQPLVMFQHKYYGLIFLASGFLQPFLIASLWGDGWNGLWIAGALPLMWSFQSTMCVNSLAHMWGERPYNTKISAVQNVIVALITFGEGWHNFHHSFPMDFRCADRWYQWNPTKVSP
eukprot:m.380809 g.380809  ORF g.380809 m.380809 type:complete len:578 (-) comp56236_c0_seq6:79-1812(-)